MNVLEELKGLPWSAGKRVNTGRGPRTVREAPATKAFWDLWNARNNECRAAGLSAKKGETGWLVVWWAATDLQVPTTGTEPQSIELKTQLPTFQAAPEPSIVLKWSDEQESIFVWFRGAITTLARALVVRARAGTGKTTTIKAAFAQAPEQRMLYAVFNKKNQREAERVITDRRVEVRTLHSLGYMFIRQVWKDAKPEPNMEFERLRSLDEDMPADVMENLVKLVGFAKNTSVNPTHLELAEICDWKDLVVTEFEKPEDGGYDVNKMAQLAHRVLELSKEKDELGRISFDDMVWLPVVKGWVRGWYELVCVDECQDMNLLQLEMAISACKQGGRICVVGDDRQAIYGFRGAHSTGIDMMKDRLDADEKGLTVTRRCPKRVVEIAAKIVPDFTAADSAPEGELSQMTYDQAVDSMQPGDAFLSRVNAPLMGPCLALLRRGVPARVEGRDIGKTLANIIKKFKAATILEFHQKLDRWRDLQTARALVRHHGREKVQYIVDQYETIDAISDGCSTAAEVEQRLLTLFQDSDANIKPAVVFSSVHKAKGLEWERVFLLQSTFNRKRAGREPDEDEKREEENIYYVALTRTKRHLVFVSDKVGNRNAAAIDNGTTKTATDKQPTPVKAEAKPKKRKPKQHKAATAADIILPRVCPKSKDGQHVFEDAPWCTKCGEPA